MMEYLHSHHPSPIIHHPSKACCYMVSGLKIPAAGIRLLLGVSFALLSLILAAQSPTLILPKDNIVTDETSLFFQWNSVAGATAYRIQIVVNDSLFTLPLRDATGTATTY